MMTAQDMMKARKLAQIEHMEHERKESRLKEMAERVYKPQNFTIQGSVNKMVSKKGKNNCY